MKPYYDHAGISIYHGDCLDVLPNLPNCELVLTDPPFGRVTRADSGLRNLDRGNADMEVHSLLEVLPLLAGKGKGSFYIFCPREYVSMISNFFNEDNFSVRLCIWEKTNPSPMNGQHLWLSSIECCVFAKKQGAAFNYFCESSVWRGPTEPSDEHPTEKPEWLMKKLIGASSNVNDLVLDAYMGSGTSLRAAKDMGRRAIGVEIQERYCEIAARRLQQEVLF